MATRTCLVLGLLALLWMARSADVIASEALERAKDLYRSAAYDEALSALETLAVGEQADAVEVQQYRVLCLVALDRKDDAQKAMAMLVTADPSFTMSEAEASPRVRTMFTEVRRSLLPSVVQRAYADAKASFDRKEPKALTQFDRVLVLLNDPVLAGNPALADLATVAKGFRELSNARAAAAPTPAANAASAPRPTTATPATPILVAPVVLSQAVPTPQIREEREWTGEIEVTIDATGHVIAARMTRPIHPVYDQQLLRAARSWTYRPALRDGSPTVSVKLITINADTRPLCTTTATDACRPAPVSR
jgi:TonB family protein